MLRTGLIFDIETDGFLEELTRVHCIVTRDFDGRNERRYHGPDGINEAMVQLRSAPVLVGHNIAEFDIPALQKLCPAWAPKGLIRDTLVFSRLIYSDMKERDFRWRLNHRDFPGTLIGSHSLEAWGHRLGALKGDYGKTEDFSTFSQEMLDYCAQDVAVTAKLWAKLLAWNYSERAIDLEHRFAREIGEQRVFGWQFDVEGAHALCARLQGRRAEIDAELVDMVSPFENHYLTKVRKEPRCKIVPFNPGSRDHVARHYKSRFGWKPTKFTDGGKAQVNETILEALPYPGAQLLSERFMVQKRLASVAEGDKSWLSYVDDDGRIRGFVNHNGCVTSRCTHSRPNVSQVTANDKPYGPQCRALFTVRPGFRLVGTDASGLELRCLAHYMGKYDGGEYQRVLLEEDIHTANQEAAEIETRELAKRFIYAFLYGAGDEKIGSLVGGGKVAGRRLKKKFLDNLPALRALRKKVKENSKERGWLRGLDGRRLPVRSAHAALNTLLQGAGAVVMKLATVILHEKLERAGLVRGVDYGQVGHIHDEIQIEARELYSALVGECAVESIVEAGVQLGLRCPLGAEFKVGRTWAETH